MAVRSQRWIRCTRSSTTIHRRSTRAARRRRTSPPWFRGSCASAPAERYASAEAVLDALAIAADAHGPSTASRASPQVLTSIAVLPFVFLSDVEDRRALSLGFADALITIFGNLEDVVVAPTSAILNYAAGVEPAQVCRDLGVRYTLQGTVQRLGAHWRVSMQLFDAQLQKITFSEKHDFTLDNVFDVQDEIGRRVVDSLHSRFPLAAPMSRDRYSSDPEAYNEFMAGLRESFADQPDTLRIAAEHLSRAVERDPDFALAHATLSLVSMNMHFQFDAAAHVAAASGRPLPPRTDAGPGAARGTPGARLDSVESGEELPARRGHRRPRAGARGAADARAGAQPDVDDLPAYRPAGRSARSRTSGRCDRIRGLEPGTSSTSTSTLGTSPARKRRRKRGTENARAISMRS